MSSSSIYRSKEGKAIIQKHYEDYLKTFAHEISREYVTTRFGKTHVLQIGPSNGMPIFIFQGGNCVNPMTLSWFSGLFNKYRIYAPDTIGHPGYSAETRMSGRDDSFALWVADLLDYYQIERSAFIGPSYGGGILLRLAAHFPKKIACSVLVAPAGLKLGSKVVMIHKILLPLIFYKLNPLGGHLQKIADAMSDFSMKEKDKWLIGDIFKYVKLEQEMPKLTEKDELFQYNAPTLVITGEKDIFFPSDMVNETAKQIITQVEIISHSMGHIPNSHSLPRVNQNIIDFLTEHYQELGKSPLIN